MFYKTNDIVSLDGWSLLHPAPMQTPLWWVTIHLKIVLWGMIFHHYYGDDDGDNEKMMMAMKDDYKRDVISGVTFHSECDDGVRTCACWQSHCSQQIFTVRWTSFYGGVNKTYLLSIFIDYFTSAGEENNIALWRLAQGSKESPVCLPAQVW